MRKTAASALWAGGRLSYAQAMLPILRMIFVGGVILAIFLPAPDDLSGSLSAARREAGIPIDIGEASSTELPVAPVEERPPAIRVPRQDADQK